METNGIDMIAQLVEEENGFGEGIETGNGYAEATGHSSFTPLVNRIAFGIAKEIAVAIKELEHHVQMEARKSAEAAERRLEGFQNELAEFSRFAGEQGSLNATVHQRLEQLASADGDLREAQSRQAGELQTIREDARDFSGAVSARFDAAMAALDESNARHNSDRESLLNEARASLQPVWERIDGLSRHVDAQQGDIATTREALNSICSRVDGFVDRLNRHAEAVRSLHGAYGQQEMEMAQAVEALVKLRATPRPAISEEL